MAPRVAFVNGGILGLLSYAAWLRRTFTDDRDIHAEHFVLTEDLSITDRVVRRILAQRLWVDRLGARNIDLARYRLELNAGWLARRRLLARGIDRFDVLHFHRQATAYASLGLMERVPAIVSIDCTQTCMVQDASSAAERWSLGFNVRRDGEIFRRAAAIVSTSRWAERDIRQIYPGCRTPIHVLANPVDLDVFDPAWIDERRVRPTPLVRCLFVGGDFPRKGGFDLLDAWRAGQFAGRAELTLVTDWPVPAPLPAGVRQQRGVRGYTPEWLDAWRSADLFVMPTRNEAFGLVYQEAAAAGLPAIGSRLNAIPEIVDEGRTGLLVTPGKVSEIRRALEELIASAELRERLGRHARTKIARDADPVHHRQALVALIRQVASNQQGPMHG
jgi:glycosyltransferase involved in cell wall biosynthesis